MMGGSFCEYSGCEVSLDELPEWIKPKDDTIDIQCGIFCHMAEAEYESP